LLRQLWLAVPLGAGVLLALAIGAGGFLPQWLGLQQERERLAALEAQRQEVTLLRRQLASLETRQQLERRRQERLTQLVTGRGSLATLMATLDREARAAGVQLDLFEPQGTAPAAAPGAPGTPGAAPAPSAGQAANPPPAGQPAATGTAPPVGRAPDLAGLQRHTVLLAAQGSFPALLSFPHRMEALSVLVVQSDLNLSLDRPKGADATKPQPLPAVVLKLAATLYEPTAARRP